MTPADFRAWLAHAGLSQREAVKVLGLGSRHTVARYCDRGAPPYIGLACAALSFGLPPWQTKKEGETR